MRPSLSLLCLVIGLGLTEGRAPSNCGLSCFRWKKCMGVVNGGNNRPGQLGDTGIIVLQECGPLKKKGCDCEEKEEEEEKIEKIEKTKEVTSAPSRFNGFSPIRSRLRNNRRGNAARVSETTTAAATTSERSLRSSLFSNRSRIYRSKRLIGGRF